MATLVVKTVYAANADDAVTVWLRPEFNKTENNQTNRLTFTAIAPLTMCGCVPATAQLMPPIAILSSRRPRRLSPRRL